MTTDLVAVVAGASTDDLDRVARCLPDWVCACAPLDDEGTRVSSPPDTATLIIVFARSKEAETLAICRQLRSNPGTATAPILLVTTRYQILQGNQVKRMGNATFVMTPFDQRSLRARVTELLENSSS